MLDSAPLAVVILLLLGGMLLAFEGGFRLHRLLSRGLATPDTGTTDESYVLSGVFGLLALLMAFALSLALDRHEQRRSLVVEEANALGTFSSRLALLPPDVRLPLQADLARYADLRVSAGRSASMADYERKSAHAEQVHAAIGMRLYAALGTGPTDTRAPLLLAPYNSTGDIATARHAARAAQLPGEVMTLLAAYCLIAAATLGYTLSGAGRPHRLASAVLFVLLAFAFTTIVDLDRPRDGFIRVPQSELAKVAKALPR